MCPNSLKIRSLEVTRFTTFVICVRFARDNLWRVVDRSFVFRYSVPRERVKMEIIVDTYGSEEQAMEWYAYLDDTLDFPFEACCITEREESPLEDTLV